MADILLEKRRDDFPSYIQVLYFGPGIEVTSIEAPIDREAFEAFERGFQPYIDARDSIYESIPGPDSWHSFVPTREKLLEYFLTLQCLDLGPGKTYLDVASCMSLFPSYLAENVGADVIRQDILYKAGERVSESPRIAPGGEGCPKSTKIASVGSDGCDMPLEEGSVDAMALHCSFEHFQGDGDQRFVREAMRVLKPGGRLLIIPFYCGDVDMEQVQDERVPGSQFHRYYHPRTFAERVLGPLDVPCAIETRYYRNCREIDPEFYCDYSICLRKLDS